MEIGIQLPSTQDMLQKLGVVASPATAVLQHGVSQDQQQRLHHQEKHLHHQEEHLIQIAAMSRFMPMTA
jgi:hypothetical protein